MQPMAIWTIVKLTVTEAIRRRPLSGVSVLGILILSDKESGNLALFTSRGVGNLYNVTVFHRLAVFACIGTALVQRRDV